jgi:DNA-binding response OmpR family regulator
MPPKILVVEDDPDLRYVYGTSLALAGFEVSSVDDGVDALVRIEQDPPDLLLLDLGLKTLGGESVAAEVTANAQTRRIPIVVVTGQRLVSSPASAACLLIKPVEVEELLRVVRRCLAEARAPASALVGAAETSARRESAQRRPKRRR